MKFKIYLVVLIGLFSNISLTYADTQLVPAQNLQEHCESCFRYCSGTNYTDACNDTCYSNVCNPTPMIQR